MTTTHPLDESDLAPQFGKFYKDALGRRSATRIRVRTTYSDGSTAERNGRVGKTTGWKPSYLLMTNSRALSSSDLLKDTDEIVAIQYSDGRYYPPGSGTPIPAPNGWTYTERTAS